MTSPPTQLLARASGVAVYSQGQRILVAELGTGWAYTLGFVLAIVGVVGTGGSVIVMTQASLAIGAVVAIVPLVALLGLWGIVSHVRKRHAMAVSDLPLRLVVDHGSGTVLDGRGHPLCSVSHAALRMRHQLGSSSRKLELVHGAGAVEIVAGNPFAGGCHPVADALTNGGLRMT
jgi:hypothetical protein